MEMLLDGKARQKEAWEGREDLRSGKKRNSENWQGAHPNTTPMEFQSTRIYRGILPLATLTNWLKDISRLL